MSEPGGRGGEDGRPISRRLFLGGAIAAGLAACSGDDGGEAASPTSSSTGPSSSTTSTLPVPELSGDPFTLGVASGDPLPDAVVLWTRLAPEPLDGGGMPETDVAVQWELAADESFDEVVQSGTFVTGPAVAHSVHVDVKGLEPATRYWYRFRVGDDESTVGRTRTAPAADAQLDTVRFVAANCHAYQSGFYTAYEHLAAEDVEFVLFQGDYIYELESSNEARQHGLEPAQSLEEFRTFYAVNKTDEQLQAAHAAHPWIITWDDHEVEDNYAGDRPGGIGLAIDPDAAETFPRKRADAYRAFWEHMPLRTGPPDADGNLRIHRDFTFGDLVTLAVLDDRQYRSPILEGEGAGNLPRSAGGGPLLEGTFDESRTILGEDQEGWLEGVLAGSSATWKVLGNQTVMAAVDRAPDDDGRGYSMDTWDGYVAARNRLLGFVRDEGIENLVSVGGDIHSSMVTDLLDDYQSSDPTLVGTEFVATSISALELLPDGFVEATLTNPHIKFYDIERRGYVVCEATPDDFRVDYRWVETTLESTAPIETAARWIVDAGAPGARPV